MNNLEVILEQIIDEIEVDAAGKGTASVRAVARLVAVQHSSILKALNGGALKPSKIAKMLMEQGFDAGALASWKTEGIPDIAIACFVYYYAYEAGSNCTEQAKLVYKAFVAIGIRVWMQNIKGWSRQSVFTAKAIAPTSEERPTLQLISEFYDLTVGKTGIDLNLVAGAKINAIVKRYPILEQEAEIGRALLSIPVEEGLVRPTELGKKLEAKTGEKWSAVRVNKLLTEQGFQIANPDSKNPAYLPTEKGKPYGKLMLDTAKGRDKTVQSLQWYLSVLEALEINYY